MIFINFIQSLKKVSPSSKPQQITSYNRINLSECLYVGVVVYVCALCERVHEYCCKCDQGVNWAVHVRWRLMASRLLRDCSMSRLPSAAHNVYVVLLYIQWLYRPRMVEVSDLLGYITNSTLPRRRVGQQWVEIPLNDNNQQTSKE